MIAAKSSFFSVLNRNGEILDAATFSPFESTAQGAIKTEAYDGSGFESAQTVVDGHRCARPPLGWWLQLEVASVGCRAQTYALARGVRSWDVPASVGP